MVDNSDWLAGLNLLQFLGQVGPHFSVNQMVKSESYESRMERGGEGLSFLEFGYMPLQAYDFVSLAESQKCFVQMGGSDQWGNICAGIELGRRVNGGTLLGRGVKRSKGLAGLTFPLLTKASGGKFGKTESGNIWLDGSLTTPYDYFQFWRNSDDADVRRFLGLFTALPLEAVAGLCAARGARALNLAKEALAFAATGIAHGVPAAVEALAHARKLFGGHGDDLSEKLVELGLAGEGELGVLQASGGRDGAPSLGIPSAEIRGGKLSVIDALIKLSLASSKNEARRLIQQRGVYLDGRPVEAVNAVIPDVEPSGSVTLRVGKKKHGILKIL